MEYLKKRSIFFFFFLLIPIPSLFWLPSGEVLAHGPIYPWPNASQLWELAVKHLFAWIDISVLGSQNGEPTGFLFYIYGSIVTVIGGSSHSNR